MNRNAAISGQDGSKGRSTGLLPKPWEAPLPLLLLIFIRISVCLPPTLTSVLDL